MQEYHGPVYVLYTSPHGYERLDGYYPAQPSARIDAFQAEELKWRADCLKEAERHERAQPSIGFDAAFHNRCAAHERQAVAKSKPWIWRIERTR